MTTSVLIIDDDRTFRALARRLLTASGMVVVGEADSVASGLLSAKRLKPAAALVDVGLPDGDGFMLARQLTTLPRPLRVVLTSVESDVGSNDEVHHSGAVTFIHKADLPSAPLAELLGGG
jgi:DNA-binding NarL/FixJ family response regulator